LWACRGEALNILGRDAEGRAGYLSYDPIEKLSQPGWIKASPNFEQESNLAGGFLDLLPRGDSLLLLASEFESESLLLIGST
jgi:hypothetical protein